MKKAAFPSKLSNTWKQCGRGYDRFVIPWEVVPMLVNPLEVSGWHLSGQTCIHLAVGGPPLQPSLLPCSLGHQQVSSTRPPGRVWVLPVPLDFSSASHPGAATPTVFGEHLGKSRDEGQFYQSHHEEELIPCLSSAKAVQALHQQGLEHINWFMETQTGLQTGLMPATSIGPILAGYMHKNSVWSSQNFSIFYILQTQMTP